MSNVVYTIVVVAVLVIAGCSSAGDTPADTSTETLPPSTTSTTVATTTSSAPSTTSTVPTTTSTTTMALGSGPLETLVGKRQSGEFWYVGPGRYTVSILPVELGVGLDQEQSFLIVRDRFIAFAEPGFLTFAKAPSLTIAELSGLADPSVNGQEVRTDPPFLTFGDDEDVTTYFEQTDPFVLLDTGTDSILGGEAPWWEFTVDASSASDGFRCAFSSTCFNVVVEPDHGNFVAAPAWVFRLWRIETGETTIWGFLQAPEDGVAEGIDLADAVLSGLSSS